MEKRRSRGAKEKQQWSREEEVIHPSANQTKRKNNSNQNTFYFIPVTPLILSDLPIHAISLCNEVRFRLQNSPFRIVKRPKLQCEMACI